MDPANDQLTSIQLPADSSLTDAAQMLGNALTEDDDAVNQYWVNLDPESQDDIIPRLPHGDPIFEINLVLLSARPGGKRWGLCLRALCHTLQPDSDETTWEIAVVHAYLASTCNITMFNLDPENWDSIIPRLGPGLSITDSSLQLLSEVETVI